MQEARQSTLESDPSQQSTAKTQQQASTASKVVRHTIVSSTHQQSLFKNIKPVLSPHPRETQPTARSKDAKQRTAYKSTGPSPNKIAASSNKAYRNCVIGNGLGNASMNSEQHSLINSRANSGLSLSQLSPAIRRKAQQMLQA